MKKSTDKILLIKTLYVYVVMIISLVILIFGSFSAIQTTVNFLVYDEYPIGYYDSCERVFLTEPDSGARGETAMDLPAKPSNENYEEECQERQERERQMAMVEDITASISSLLVGSLVFVPHAIWSRKLKD